MPIGLETKISFEFDPSVYDSKHMVVSSLASLLELMLVFDSALITQTKRIAPISCVEHVIKNGIRYYQSYSEVN